jgi:hypothetical protein
VTERTEDGEVVWGEIDGQVIAFPMAVPDVGVATVMYDVPLAAAAALLPGDAFEIVETAPGTAQLVLAACDYRDNPWGDYDEINLGFLARPRGAPPETIGSFVYRMPVNQSFTCEAGNRVMGFPKTVEGIEVTRGEGSVTFVLVCDGEMAMRLSVPTPEPTDAPVRIAAVSYSYLDGAPYATTLEMDMGEPVVDTAAVTIELGSGVVADELRSLGLPTTPGFASWGERLGAVFHLGEPVVESA